jgi:hypothetical protein
VWPNPRTLPRVGMVVALTAAANSAINNSFCRFIRYSLRPED